MKDDKKIMRAPKYGGHSGNLEKINSVYIVMNKAHNYYVKRTKKTLIKVAKRAYVDTKGKFYVLSGGVAFQSGDYVSTLNARSIDDEKTLTNLCEKHLDGEFYRKYLGEEVSDFGDGVKKMHDKEEFLYSWTAKSYLMHLLALSVFEEFGALNENNAPHPSGEIDQAPAVEIKKNMPAVGKAKMWHLRADKKVSATEHEFHVHLLHGVKFPVCGRFNPKGTHSHVFAVKTPPRLRIAPVCHFPNAPPGPAMENTGPLTYKRKL